MSAGNNKITPAQLFCTLFLSRLFASMTYIAGLDRDLKPGETVVAMVSAALFLFAGSFFDSLFLKNDGGAGIITRSNSLLKPAGKVVSLIYFLFFTAYSSVAAARFNLFINTVMFPKNEMKWLILLVLLGCACIALSGIEAVGRSSVIFTFIVAVSVLFVFSTVMSKFDILNFQGLRSSAAADIFASGFSAAARTAELASIPVITPFVRGRMKGSLYKWTGVTAFFIVLIAAVNSGVLGRFGYEQLFPMYSLTVLAEFGVLERLDAMITAVWILCFIAKMSYFLFVNSYLLSGFIKCRRRYLPFVSALLITAGALAMSGSVDSLAKTVKSGILAVVFIVGTVVIPMSVVIGEKIKGNNAGKAGLA